eukprot:scaffold2006_cov18-Tisochrysis_lutea.AAC.1
MHIERMRKLGDCPFVIVIALLILRSPFEVEDRAVLGYGPELQTTAFELVASKNPRTPIDKGEGYVQMAVSTK